MNLEELKKRRDEAKHDLDELVKKLSNTKLLACRQEYFMCIVESQHEGEHHD